MSGGWEGVWEVGDGLAVCSVDLVNEAVDDVLKVGDGERMEAKMVKLAKQGW